ncbi:hypothetical protein RB195_022335 [Necator americanus]|uniref:Uncharacterized protein n=1 Tax=Necator americanus TaxID=51031 RepID=A0ABR1EEX0_NECAM
MWISKHAKRPRGSPPTRWGDVFVWMGQLRAQLDTAQGRLQRHSRNLRTWRGNETSGRDARACTSNEDGPSKYISD